MTTERPTVLHPVTIVPEAPEGYVLPKQAADLMAHATANGWLARAIWVAGPDIDEPFVCVDVCRTLVEGEEPVCPTDEHAQVRGGRWSYRVTWHSRDCVPGKLKLFRRPLAATPWRPQTSDGPSVRGIRDMISGFPARGKDDSPFPKP